MVFDAIFNLKSRRISFYTVIYNRHVYIILYCIEVLIPSVLCVIDRLCFLKLHCVGQALSLIMTEYYLRLSFKFIKLMTE